MALLQKHLKSQVFRLFLGLGVTMAWFVFPAATQAVTDDTTRQLAADEIIQAQRLTTPNLNASLLAVSNTLTTPGQLRLVTTQIDTTPFPTGLKRVSEYWVYDVKQAEKPTLLQKSVTIVLPYTSTGEGKRAAFISYGGKWHKLWSKDHPSLQRMTIRTQRPYGQIVVLENDSTFEGMASWYADSRYPYGAAMNLVPMGSKVRVTNLENGKSVVVTIVSRGPYVNGRVVDLVSTAFSEIASTRAGVARVRASLVTSGAVAVPGGVPTLNSRAAVVLDPSTNQVLTEKNSTGVRSIASLTKMMTALVVMDTNPDFNQLVTMIASDIPTPEPGSRVRVNTGEKLRIKDLFYSMVTASANNAAYALARSTGLTRAQFVAKMNAKANALGMHHTTFADPSGLDTRNKSTAHDMALLATAAFANPKIRDAGSMSRYTFREHTSLDGVISHTVRHPLYIYNALLNNAPIETAKTGFLNEAGECVAFIAKSSSGKEYVVVLLGGSTATSRANDANALMRWASRQI